MNGMIMLAMVVAILAPNIALAWRVQRLTNEVRSLRQSLAMAEVEIARSSKTTERKTT